MTRSQALVFDFDGTILDTETPVYESWAEAFRHGGAEPVALDVWLQHIGKADGHGLDMRALLCAQLGVDEVPQEIEDRRRAVRNEMLHASPLRSGVRSWIEAALAADVPLAIASSSPSGWVVPHLERIGLDGHFPVVSCADPPTPGKPDPTVFVQACARLQVAAVDALAIEDSPHGVSAAIGAGMRCIAAPGPMTASLDFSHATAHAEDLAALDPADWLAIS